MWSRTSQGRESLRRNCRSRASGATLESRETFRHVSSAQGRRTLRAAVGRCQEAGDWHVPSVEVRPLETGCHLAADTSARPQSVLSRMADTADRRVDARFRHAPGHPARVGRSTGDVCRWPRHSHQARRRDLPADAVLDGAEQCLVLALAPALRATQSGVVPTRMQHHRPAKRSHRVLHLLLADKGAPHVECLAKYAVAFLGMSRSSVTRRSSDFSRRISTAIRPNASPLRVPDNPTLDDLRQRLGPELGRVPRLTCFHLTSLRLVVRPEGV